MYDKDVFRAVKRVVAAECGLKINNISNHTRFMTNPGQDYFDCLGVLYTLQHKFGVVLPESKYDMYTTVGGLTKDIVNQLNVRKR